MQHCALCWEPVGLEPHDHMGGWESRLLANDVTRRLVDELQTAREFRKRTAPTRRKRQRIWHFNRSRTPAVYSKTTVTTDPISADKSRLSVLNATSNLSVQSATHTQAGG